MKYDKEKVVLKILIDKAVKRMKGEKMSINKLHRIFKNITTYDAWSIQLLQIKNSRRTGIGYFGREIYLSPSGKLNEFIEEISKKYIDEEKGILLSYEKVIDYNGSNIGNMVYKLGKDSNILKQEYESLIEAIANPDTESNPLEYCYQAYLLRGIISVDGKEHPVKLISMQNPITFLKHKFLRNGGTFEKVEEKVLSLKPSIDVVIYDDMIYMMTLAGEKLFNMERSYRNICKVKLRDIQDLDIINNFDLFENIASSGHNPRCFVSFNEQHMIELRDIKKRRRAAKKFSIHFVDGKFDILEINDATKLVKLLCDRGMIDPFDESPREVAGSTRWL